MTALSEFVSVTLTIQDASISQVGFGTPAILGRTSAFSDLARTYSSTTAMLADGFTATDPEIAVATAIFSQQPHPPQLKFLRQTSTPTAQTIVLTVASVLNDTLYTVTINGTAFTFTSDSDATNLEIAAGLVAAINLGSEPVTATDNLDGTFDLVADVAGTLFTLAVDRTQLTQDDQTAAEDVVADLTAARGVDDDWYTLHMVSNATADIVAMAAHVQTLLKVLFVQSADDDIPADTASNLFETLALASYDRTVGMYTELPSQYIAAGWAGRCLPAVPGSINWAFKSIVGSTPIVVSDTERDNVFGNNGNLYRTFAGANVTFGGTTFSGRFISNRRTVDKLQVRIEEELFLTQISSDKIPFTDAGGTVIETAIRNVIQRMVNDGALTEDYTVTIPKVADISQANKAVRNFAGVEIVVQLAGAVNTITITGDVLI